MTKLQRLILVLISVILGLMTFWALDQRHIRGYDWLWPLLVSGGLLFLAASGAGKNNHSRRSDQSTHFKESVHKNDPSNKRLSRLISETEQLANEVFGIIELKSTPVDGAEIFLTRQGGEKININEFSKLAREYLNYNAQIECLCFSYSLIWLRPNRKDKTLPNHPEFIEFRNEIARRLFDLVKLEEATAGTALSVGIDTLGGSFAKSADEIVEQHLSVADQRRMLTEQDMKFDRLIEPLMKSYLTDRKVAFRSIQEIMMRFASRRMLAAVAG